MKGSSSNHQPPRVLPLETLSMPLNIGGETNRIDCVVTRHGHLLINASQYAMAFTGCTSKDASTKIAVVAGRLPELQNDKKSIHEHDKVRHTIAMPLQRPRHALATPSPCPRHALAMP